MNILVLDTNSSKTPQLLAEELGVEVVEKVPEGFGGLVVNWGVWNCKLEGPKLPYKILNHPMLIRYNRAKLTSIRYLSESGIKTPKLYLEGNFHNMKLPVIGRTSVHQGGSGFYMCLCQFDIRHALRMGAEYFTEYVPVRKEYRVHVFKDSIIDASEKVRGNGFLNKWVRSVNKGWKFKRLDDAKELPNHVYTMAWKSVKLLKLDFGAVDVIQSEAGEYFVLEVNSAPGLRKEGRVPYLEKIKELYKNNLGSFTERSSCESPHNTQKTKQEATKWMKKYFRMRTKENNKILKEQEQKEWLRKSSSLETKLTSSQKKK
jgi:hypothetical protein